ASAVDLGVVFLLPPFADRPDPDVRTAFADAPRAMLRPAGGLAPGGSWRDDGISWTTSTSSYALAAAALADRAAADRWLRWLDAHRTGAGSLPEKVLADGRPAAVAPPAWASAAVVLAAVELGG
ncbi:MAG: Glucoamylase, partial [uncultured Friedmanniella sp.]